MDMYDRQGQPIHSMEEWVALLTPENKRVAQTTVGQVWVSTVWLGVDHGFGGGPPIIFETMAFVRGVSYADLLCYRYATEAEALAGHQVAVEYVSDGRRRHGWVKHARDQRRHDQKLALQDLAGPFARLLLRRRVGPVTA